MDVRELPTDSDNYEMIKFLITGTSPAFANALRRTILGYVPTLAIEEVIFVENSSPMFDEYIAHRLGLVPLNSEIELNDQKTCDVCEGVGCDACTVTLTLTQETDASSEMTVYSRDLIANNMMVYPIDDEIPIIKMGYDQRLILEALARLGTGREHAKWQPTASLGYQYMPIIDIKPNHEFTEKVANSCPRDVFGYDEKNKSLSIENQFNCNLCMECVKASDEGTITVNEDPSQIIFMVESTGALPVEDIVTQAADRLKELAENFVESFQIALEEAESDPSKRKKVSTFERISIEEKQE